MSGTQDHANAQDSHAPHGARHDGASHAAGVHDAHEGPIKTPKQLALAVFFAFVIPIIVLVLAANYVTSEVKPGAGTQVLEDKAVEARIRPVAIADFKDLNDPGAMKTGEQVFQGQCAACHATGMAGSPKFGDADAWGPRIKTGYETLLHSALKGKGAMGPQGGGDFSDFEIARAVVYMANHGGAKFDEPKMAAPGAAASDAASAPVAAASAASQ